ncbi:MAG: zinc ribbon domain-containing protein, partial [Nocardioidaceae bacterium]|nr:zinc ribbon domain-containing protein [Nocardioidaceae bacterium]
MPVCRACGNANEIGSAFCADCGSPLTAGCPACGAATTPGQRFCRACGAAL